MPNRVIALIFAHTGDFDYEQVANNDTKRGLRRVNKALEQHYDKPVGTKFGDRRGRDANGDEVLSYALCMTTTKDEVPWLMETFWEGGSSGWTEMTGGVGYMNKGGGRVRFFALDTSTGDEGLNALLQDITGEELTVAPIPVKADKASSGSKSTNPFDSMDAGQLSALCEAAGVEVEEGLSKEDLMARYLEGLVDKTEGVATEPYVDPTDVEPVPEFDPEGKTNKELKAELDNRGIAYKSSANKADLVALLS